MDSEDPLVQDAVSLRLPARRAVGWAVDRAQVLLDEEAAVRSVLLSEVVPYPLRTEDSPVLVVMVATAGVAEEWRKRLARQESRTARERLGAAESTLAINYFSRLPGVRRLFDIVVISQRQLNAPDNVVEELECVDLPPLKEILAAAIDTRLYT